MKTLCTSRQSRVFSLKTAFSRAATNYQAYMSRRESGNVQKRIREGLQTLTAPHFVRKIASGHGPMLGAGFGLEAILLVGHFVH